MTERTDNTDVEEPNGQQAEERELSAEELDQVSGGFTSPSSGVSGSRSGYSPTIGNVGGNVAADDAAAVPHPGAST